jgi:hypothetical protein
LRWISERDKGQADAINKGFRMCSGEIVAWINADDLLLKGAVEKAVAAFRQDSDLGMVYGEGYLIDAEGWITGRFPYTEPFNLWRLVHYGDTILQQTVFMRRSALEEVGYLDETLHWGLDWDLFIRLGKRYRVRYIPEFLACLREHSTTKTSTGGYRRLQELGRVVKRHAGRMLAPSYLAYAHDFFYAQMPELIRDRMSGGLGRLAAGAVRRLSGMLQSRVWLYMEESQGWYPDGAAGRESHFLLPNLWRPAQIEIEGRLPQFSPEPQRQTLTVRVNGKVLAKLSLAPGPFQVVTPVPDWINGADVLRVDLAAAECISDRHYVSCGRTREISFYLNRVEVTPARAAEAEEGARVQASSAAAR